MIDYADLIGRLGNLRVPDRQLEIDIMYAEIHRGCGINVMRTPELDSTANRYTSSIDAALTLVPHGLDYELVISGTRDGRTWTAAYIKWWVMPRTEDEGAWHVQQGNSEIAAVAILQAIFRYRLVLDTK